MIAASLNRHGVKPDSFVALKTALISLGERIDEAPRDTVFSYGPRNPQTGGLRNFTGAAAEKDFIHSFVAGMTGLNRSITLLVKARYLQASSKDFAVCLNEAETEFSIMINAVVDAQTNMPRGFFAAELRPYFEPFELNGVKYLGPSGSQMPVLVLDNLVWGSDQDIEGYKTYKKAGIKYSSPPLRKIFVTSDDQPSIVSSLFIERERNSTLNLEAIESVIKLLNTLIDFRVRHKQLATNDFALRDKTAVGSGGI